MILDPVGLSAPNEWIALVAVAVAAGLALGFGAGARRARRAADTRASAEAAAAAARAAMAEARLLAVLGAATSEALLVVDGDDRLRFANRIAREWFDIDDDASGATPTRRRRPLHQSRPPLRSILRSAELHELVAAARDGTPSGWEIAALEAGDPDRRDDLDGVDDPDGVDDFDGVDDRGPVEHTVPLRDHIYRVRVQRLEDGGAVISLRDDTEVERLARARRDLVANISHDLRTPLTSIRLLVDTLLEAEETGPGHAREAERPVAQDGAEATESRAAPDASGGRDAAVQGADPVARRRLLAIRDQAATLERLADGLVQLNRLDTGRALLQLRVHPLAAIVAKALDAVAPQFAERGVALESAVPDDFQVLADEPQITRVLTNLLDNALHASRPGQRVQVAAAPARDRGDSRASAGTATGTGTAAEADAGFVEIAVQDQGPGIAPDEVERIFERFYRGDRARASGGSGLGLAIARHIVEGHGGSIALDRSYRKGARFRFTVPRAPAPTPAPTPASASAPPPGSPSPPRPGRAPT